MKSRQRRPECAQDCQQYTLKPGTTPGTKNVFNIACRDRNRVFQVARLKKHTIFKELLRHSNRFRCTRRRSETLFSSTSCRNCELNAVPNTIYRLHLHNRVSPVGLGMAPKAARCDAQRTNKARFEKPTSRNGSAFNQTPSLFVERYFVSLLYRPSDPLNCSLHHSSRHVISPSVRQSSENETTTFKPSSPM